VSKQRLDDHGSVTAGDKLLINYSLRHHIHAGSGAFHQMSTWDFFRGCEAGPAWRWLLASF